MTIGDVIQKMGANFLVALFLLAALVASSSATVSLKAATSMYSQFKMKYGRVHKSEDEASLRFAIFLKNLRYIEELNNKGDGARYGITKFADWTDEELAKLTPASDIDLSHLIKMKSIVVNGTEIPDNFDWRTQSGVTPVKDQDKCGGCWAFTTVAVVESLYAIKNKQMLDLSEQQLIDCEPMSSGCDGGSYPYALRYLLTKGLLTEEDYPYLNEDGPSCPAKNGNIFLSQVYKIDTDADQMAAFIYKYGPIGVHIKVTQPLYSYKSGIYSPDEIDCLLSNANHAVTAVGYGVENGVKYWLIKNSWGSDWGDGGYFKMLRGTNACEVEIRPYGAEL